MLSSPRRGALLWPLVLLLLPVRAALAQALNFTNQTALGYDPVKLMCARWEHQSVLRGNTLYIDGGLETTYYGMQTDKDFFLGLNYYLLEVDMSDTWNWKTNITIDISNKSASTPAPPTSLRGQLFQGTSDDTKIYLYGGADFPDNTTERNYTTSNAGTLWSFDVVKNGSWEKTDISDVSPWQPNRGAHAEAPDLGLAFYLNGEISAVHTVQSWGNLTTQTAHLEGMIVLDTANRTGKTAWNVSTTSMTGGSPRSGAGMTYVPGIGDSGALVLIGGLAREATTVNDPSIGELVNLSQIQVFDIASWLNNTSGTGNWYSQTANGDIPDLRTDFCIVAGTAPDNSSYNIYIYGGRNPKSNTIYDDVYALSLPSFTWIKLFSGQSPRWGHTCHMVPNSTQLITVGGALSNYPTECDWEYRGVAVLDSHTIGWGSTFDRYAPSYKVTQGISQVIGGSDGGGATTTSPSGGFNSTALQTLFKRSTGSQPKRSSNAGAIAGGVVGGVCALALVSGLAFFLYRRRQRNNRRRGNPTELEASVAERHEAPGTESEKPEHAVAAQQRQQGGDVELPGHPVVSEMDGEDHFERIVELDPQAERFELQGSDVRDKERERWQEARVNGAEGRREDGGEG